jgi:hypothetical protein
MDNLPEPEAIAEEIVENLEAGWPVPAGAGLPGGAD